MYNGIGLQTARGSGTNGYVQTNKFFVRPRNGGKPVKGGKGFEDDEGTAGLSKKPNKAILEHDRKRQIHLKLAILEDKLADQGYSDIEIAQKLEEARVSLEAAAAANEEESDSKVSNTQTHQVAARKEKQMEAFRAALGLPDQQQVAEEGIIDDEPMREGFEGRLKERREHSFLDRDSGRKKVDEDVDEKDAKVKESKKQRGGDDDDVDVVKRHKKKESKKRRHDDSSESDEHGRDRRRRSKKKAKGRKQESESDSSSSDSESDSDSDDGKKRGRKKPTKTTKKRSRRKRSVSSESEEVESDDSKKLRKSHKKSLPSNRSGSKELRDKHDEQSRAGRKRHDSDVSEPESEDNKQPLRKKEEAYRGGQKQKRDDEDVEADHLKDRYTRDDKKAARDSDDSEIEYQNKKQLRSKVEVYSAGMSQKRKEEEDVTKHGKDKYRSDSRGKEVARDSDDSEAEYENRKKLKNESYQRGRKLNRLISSLPDLTPTINGFYNISINGEVNAIALCRGDVKPNQDCISCITTAAKQLVESCPNIIEANIWLEKCMFRYTSRIILGQMEPVPFSYTSSNVSVTDKEGFSKGLGDLLDSLGAKIDAANETKEVKFAAGVKGTIYALAQCTPDLSESDCRICLAQIFAGVPTCCDGKTGGWWTNPSCYFRFEVYPFFDLSVTSEQKQPLSSHNNNTRRSDQGKSKDRSKTLIFAVVPIVAIILGLVFLFIYLKRRRKKKTLKENAENEFESTDSLHFDFETIRVATDDFSLTNKIGEGGFGVVYKGHLPDGLEIAVKRLSIHSGQGNAEFKTEVLLMTKLQHKNLVKLFGFSIKESERLLVYEFIPNTSLDRFLFDPIKQKQLDWEKRYNIIVGVSRGLLYLHEGSEFPIIHRDLKSSNVLLDEQMLPKISDFGMARQFDFDNTQAVTRRVVGTYGYMAPEYAMHGRFSVKTDVYSFGVLVLEIITGKRNSGLGLGEGTDLPTFAWQNWIEGTSMELIDPVLLQTHDKKESMQCLEIALSCVQENPTKRPTMDSVVSMLSSDSESRQLPKPSQPGFFRRSASFSISLNDVSLTDLSAR